MNKDRIRGLFLGIGIGDALGMPVEGFSAERIKEEHGKITTYVSAKGHKWFDGQPLGAWTDDCQLSISVAEALIEAGDFDMDKIAEHHVKAFNKHTSGWGPSTKEAIKKLADGVYWKESGNFEQVTEAGKLGKSSRGFGNGIAMKVSPIGAFLAAKPFDYKEVVAKLADFSAMTHRTSMAVSSGLAQAFATFRCLTSTQENFSKQNFLATVVNLSELGKKFFPDTLQDDITDKFRMLAKVTDKSTDEDFIKEYGKGSVYVYHSLPFTYAFFIRKPTSIESLYEVTSAGGDTDSNASILGGLLGALNGTGIFPKHLIDGLQNKDEIIALADRFSDKFGI